MLNRENFEAIKKEQVWGVTERHKKQLLRSKSGDICAFYLIAEGHGGSRKESVIGGIAVITSEPYKDICDIFPSKRNYPDVYPYRIGLSAIKIFEPYLPFKPLVPYLSFIKNKKKLFNSSLRKSNDGDT